METTSLLSALGSSWALPFLCATRWTWLQHTALCHRRWHRLRMGVLTLRRVANMTLGFLDRSRRFSSTIDQFNLLYFRASQIHEVDKNFGWMARKLGFEDWWDSAAYSWTIKIPERVKERAVTMVSRDDINTMGMLRQKWGELGLHKKRYPGLQQPDDVNSWHGLHFQESIIIWHIATDLILADRNQTSQNHGDGRKTSGNEALELVEAIRAVPNYLMFLLVTRPDMLPGLPQNWLYEQTCRNIDKRCKKNRDKLISSGGKASNNPFFRVLKKLLRGHSIRCTTPFGVKRTKKTRRNPTREEGEK
uniref:DUF4220 domain-containing protein n=1 Tax=Oryza brachyantha TaxID=4533 RepID=J3LVJ3_ORYBR